MPPPPEELPERLAWFGELPDGIQELRRRWSFDWSGCQRQQVDGYRFFLPRGRPGTSTTMSSK